MYNQLFKAILTLTLKLLVQSYMVKEAYIHQLLLYFNPKNAQNEKEKKGEKVSLKL